MQRALAKETLTGASSRRNIISSFARLFVNKPIATQSYKGVRVITPNYDTRNNPRYNTGLRIGNLQNDKNTPHSTTNVHPVREHNIHTLTCATPAQDSVKRARDLKKIKEDLKENHPEKYVRQNWINHLLTHKFTVAADFVAQLGKNVNIIDIRQRDELIDPVGYIPGANWFPREDFDKILDAFPEDSLIAVVCMNDSESREVVRKLHENRRHLAAIMAGGMRSWKLMGFSTSFNDSIKQRQSVRVSFPNAERFPCPINERGKRQLSLNMINDHIGDGSFIQWIKIAAFMVHGRLSCVDGRDDCGIIGTPGGDVGEFVLALSVAEELLNRELTPHEIKSLFKSRLGAFGRFYMHTDEQCLASIKKAILEDPELKQYISDPMSLFVNYNTGAKIPEQCREGVLDLLLQPDLVGCGHLRLLMTRSEDYKVRRELVTMVLRCFFHAFWDGATECDFVVLSGLHEECGVANVSVAKEVQSFTRIPLIPPTIQGNQMFVSHEQITTYLRNQQAHWFISQSDILNFSRTAAVGFSYILNLRADLHSSLTLSALAADLPMFSLRFSEAGVVEMSFNGIINPPEQSEITEMDPVLKTIHTPNKYVGDDPDMNLVHAVESYFNSNVVPVTNAISHKTPVPTRSAESKPGETYEVVGNKQTIPIVIPHIHNKFAYGYAHPFTPPTSKMSDFWTNGSSVKNSKDVKKSQSACGHKH